MTPNHNQILIINGPNLNLLGYRQPQIYGNTTFEDYFKLIQTKYSAYDLGGNLVCTTFAYEQFNSEGQIIDCLQRAEALCEAIVLNPGAYAHTSIAIRDCILSINKPVVEVHISNIFAREEFRHTDLIAPVCKGLISGFDMFSYDLAILYCLNNLCKKLAD